MKTIIEIGRAIKHTSDVILKMVGMATSCIITCLDKTIETVQIVSKKIIYLFISVFKLLFYLAPFILTIMKGLVEKEPDIFFYIACIAIFFAFIFFISVLFSSNKDPKHFYDDESELSKKSKLLIFIIVLVLNLIAIYVFFDTSITQYIYSEKLCEDTQTFFNNKLFC